MFQSLFRINDIGHARSADWDSADQQKCDSVRLRTRGCSLSMRARAAAIACRTGSLYRLDQSLLATDSLNRECHCRPHVLFYLSDASQDLCALCVRDCKGFGTADVESGLVTSNDIRSRAKLRPIWCHDCHIESDPNSDNYISFDWPPRSGA